MCVRCDSESSGNTDRGQGMRERGRREEGGGGWRRW